MAAQLSSPQSTGFSFPIYSSPFSHPHQKHTHLSSSSFPTPMSISTSLPTFHLFQNFLTTVDLRSRRFLLHPPLLAAAAAASPPAPPEPRPGFGSFDMNVVMVLSVLLCALVCSLGLNAILKCALRCTTLLASMSANGTSFQSGGLVHRGVRRKALKTFPTVEYSKEEAKLIPGLLEGECVICLSEFEPGERLRLLPKCYHGFHVHCIDKWLSSHTSCPKCRNCLTETCRKIVGVPASSSSVYPPPAPATVAAENVVVNIAPLERETLICNYRESR